MMPGNSFKGVYVIPKQEEMNLKNQLKHYLEKKDISVTKLSKLSGVPQQTIHDWLTGNSKNPAIGQLHKVCKALNVSLDNLCYGEGSEKNENRVSDIEALLGEEWIGGLFEIRIRRVKDKK